MNEEILRCIDSMRGEISDTIASLLAADDGLKDAEELIRTGRSDGGAHNLASVYTAGRRTLALISASRRTGFCGA